MATEQENNKALVLKMYEEVWNHGNMDYGREVVSPEFRDHPPARFWIVPVRGREALIEAASHFRAAAPDFHDQLIQCVAEADKVVYLGRITGTHTQPFFEFPGKGGKIDIMGINYFRLQGGKIVERWGIFDSMKLMQQMGVIPAAPPAGH